MFIHKMWLILFCIRNLFWTTPQVVPSSIKTVILAVILAHFCMKLSYFGCLFAVCSHSVTVLDEKNDDTFVIKEWIFWISWYWLDIQKSQLNRHFWRFSGGNLLSHLMAHNPEAAGSSPAPTTKKNKIRCFADLVFSITAHIMGDSQFLSIPSSVSV